MSELLATFGFLIPPVCFLAVNVIVLRLISTDYLRKAPPAPKQPLPVVPSQMRTLEPLSVLGWEFEYAKTTASEAMQDRHTMINYYLLVAGVVTTGVITVVSNDADALPNSIGTLLLWLLCGIGWLYFMKLVQLRHAWGGSVAVMCRIKEFCMSHVSDLKPDEFRGAFLWDSATRPPLGKRWTVFYLSAMLIAYLDGIAFVAGSVLLARGELGFAQVSALGVLGVLFFLFTTGSTAGCWPTSGSGRRPPRPRCRKNLPTVTLR